jgi:hypothetical protein
MGTGEGIKRSGQVGPAKRMAFTFGELTWTEAGTAAQTGNENAQHESIPELVLEWLTEGPSA